MKIIPILLTIALGITMAACGGEKRPPVNLHQSTQSHRSEIVEVPYTERRGVKIIPAQINGASLDMIFDTGCSGISLSELEFFTLYKNDCISIDDLIDVSEASIADGSVVRTFNFYIREVKIGGNDGITINNVTASVVPNQAAPVLLGNNVFDQIASYEVDNNARVIRFHKN